MNQDPKQAQEAINKDVELYRKLKQVKKSAEFGDFFDFLIRTSANKILDCFIGKEIKTWEDFLRVRGEIVSYLYIMQEVGGAEAIEKYLQEQLKQYFEPK